MIDIYTDGSSTGKVGPGGWAFVVVDSGIITARAYGGQDGTTNNQMELYAVTQALKYIHEKLHDEFPCTIWSDSQYVVRGINEYYPKWNLQMKMGKKLIKNQAFWLELKEVRNLLTNVEIKWIKGHSGNEYNDIADKLAKEGKDIIKVVKNGQDK